MLSIGSIVRLKDGTQELMILNRAPLLEREDRTVWFDYSACRFPTGLSRDEIFYFNEENIDEVLFEGYYDENEEQFRKAYQEWLEKESSKIPKGSVDAPLKD